MRHANSLANLRSGGGRAGKPSKVPQAIKEMIEHALHKAGGVDYLTEQAHANPTAFMGLVGRVLPLQVSGSLGTEPGALHLLAATLVSEAIINALGDEATKPHPPQIDAQPIDVLDSPKPTE